MENMEIELVEEGVIDAMVIDAEVIEVAVENRLAPGLPPAQPAQLFHPFFRSRTPRLPEVVTEARPTATAPSLVPVAIRENAREYLDAPSTASDSDLVLSARQQPRAGPYGKRKRGSDAQSEVVKGSEPKGVTVEERILEFPHAPFRDLDGAQTSLLLLSPFRTSDIFSSNSLLSLSLLGVLYCEACSEPIALKMSTIKSHLASGGHKEKLKVVEIRDEKQVAITQFVEVSVRIFKISPPFSIFYHFFSYVMREERARGEGSGEK